MQELMQKRKEQLAQATITQLRRRGFEAEWFDTAAQAREAALQLLPEGCTVAWGGSATIREMGLTQAVHAGNWTSQRQHTLHDLIFGSRKLHCRKSFPNHFYNMSLIL